MNDYDPILFTQRQVFGRDTASGTLSTNDDYNEHIRPFGSPKPPAVQYDMLDYLENGAGRYAIPAVFPIVDDFFGSSIPQKPNGQPYNVSEIRQELNLLDNTLFDEATKTSIWQYGTDTTSTDFAERAYIFGTTDFTLDLTNAEFEVTANGNKFITGMQVIAEDDNFDFRGGAGPINAVANKVLLPAYDPYGLGIDPTTNGKNREVPIEYTTSISGRTYGTFSDPYSKSDWVIDDLYETAQISIKGTVSGAVKLALGISKFFGNPTSVALANSYLSDINSDPFLRYLRDDFKVIYGTPGNDNITHFDREFDRSDPLPINTPVLIAGGNGNDTITGSSMSDELLGGENSDVLEGRGGDDTLDGGQNVSSRFSSSDTAVFSDNFENYQYSIASDQTITFDHNAGTQTDGKDTLKNLEFAQFQDRTVALPLEDGPLETKTVEFLETDDEPFVNVSLTMPTYMLDRDADYTVNISPLPPNSTYNIALIIDISASMNGGPNNVGPTPLQQAKDAYTDLIDYFIDNGIAENARFTVIPFNNSAEAFPARIKGEPLSYFNPEDAKSFIQGLTASGNTDLNKPLEKAFERLIVAPFKQQRIAYFLSDGRDDGFIDTELVKQLQRNVDVQVFGIGNEIDSSQLDTIDSDQAVILPSGSDLATEFLKSTITRDDISRVEIRLEGESTPVRVIQPNELVDTPLGLSISGSIDDLDVSLDAENKITAEVFYTDPNLPSTPVNFTVTSGQSKVITQETQDGNNNNPQAIVPSNDGSGEQDLFTNILNGSSGDDTLNLGSFDLGANGEAGNDRLVGNNHHNLLNGGSGDDTIFGNSGDDQITITPGNRNTIDGGDGIDTVIYSGVSKPPTIPIVEIGAQAVMVNFNDILTDVEFVQYTDARVSTKTLEVTPTIQVDAINVTEGNASNATAQLTFNLDSPAPVDGENRRFMSPDATSKKL